ncbi:hypothetical protein AB1N83_008232 [Pleurotus pulmonarius]
MAKRTEVSYSTLPGQTAPVPTQATPIHWPPVISHRRAGESDSDPSLQSGAPREFCSLYAVQSLPPRVQPLTSTSYTEFDATLVIGWSTDRSSGGVGVGDWVWLNSIVHRRHIQAGWSPCCSLHRGRHNRDTWALSCFNQLGLRSAVVKLRYHHLDLEYIAFWSASIIIVMHSVRRRYFTPSLAASCMVYFFG